MFLFRKHNPISMEEAQKRMAEDPSIRVIDVRTAAEYRQGHIPGSINLPMDRLSHIQKIVPDKHHAKLMVYSFSGGSQSREACETLKRLGYHHVTNMGGIAFWTGKLERPEEE